MFRPALSRITSSMASTASYGLSRVLSFTGSFNSRTSLLAHDWPSGASPSPAQESAPSATTLSIGGLNLDIEAAAPEDTRDAGGDGGLQVQQQQADEPKRVSKSVHTVCLFVASASLVLLINLPSKNDSDLYSVNLAFICLSMLTSLGLSMFSIVARPGEPAVARVQKRAMLMAMAFVLVSFTLRMFMMLPAVSLESASLFFFLFAGVAALYLFLAWKMGSGRTPITANIPGEETGPVVPPAS